MSEPKLTEDEMEYLQKLFFEHREKIANKLDQELLILSKYKGALACAYESVGAHNNTLIGCMKDILAKQDELIGLCNQLGDMAQRIENFFLNDVPPKQTNINMLIEELELPVRPFKCLKSLNINTVNELINRPIMDLYEIPKLGIKSITEIKDALARRGLRLRNDVPPKAKESTEGLLIEELGLSERALHGLKSANINTVRVLLKCSAKDLCYISNLGIKRITEIKDALARHGWRLRND